MIRLNTLATASCVALINLALASSARADQWNKRTIITSVEPIQVPGKLLQPGTYVMKLLDSQANRHVVQVFNEREDQLLATILAIPNYRLQVTDKSEFQWWETPAGQPKALRAWFYPGDNFGQEFAYPKSEAVAIAAASKTNVPITYAETEAELATARVGTVDRAGTETELDQQTYSHADGMQSNEIAEDRTAPPPDFVRSYHVGGARRQPAVGSERQTVTTAAAPDISADRLPGTASSGPTAGLAGLLALGASIVVRTSAAALFGKIRRG